MGVFGVIVVSVTQPVGGSRLVNLPNFDLNLEYSGQTRGLRRSFMTPSQVARLGLFAYQARSPACSRKSAVPLA